MKRLLTFLVVVALAFFLAADSLQPTMHGQGQEDPREKLYKGKIDKNKLPKDKFQKGHPDAIPNEYVVVFKDSVNKADVAAFADELTKKFGGAIKDKNKDIWTNVLKGFAATMPEAVALAMSQDPRIDHISESTKIRLLGVTDPTIQAKEKKALNQKELSEEGESQQGSRPQNGTGYAPEDTQIDFVKYNLDRIDQINFPLNLRYTYYNTAYAINVYTIDTGVNFNHQEFEGTRAFLNYSYFSDGLAECGGHGTEVASLAVGKYLGPAKKANILAVRAFDCNGNITKPTLISAINYIATNHIIPCVVSMAYTSYDPNYLNTDIDQAVYNLIHTYDVATFVAAAWSYDGSIVYDQSNYTPGRVSGTVTVGMTDSSDQKVDYNNAPPYRQSYGSFIDIYAPAGPNRTTSYPPDHTGVSVAYGSGTNQYFHNRVGTSYATPLVAGVGALYLDSNRYAHWYQVRDAVLSFGNRGKLSNLNTGDNNVLLWELFGIVGNQNAASYAAGTAPDSLATQGAVYTNPLTGASVTPDSLKIEDPITGQDIPAQTTYLSSQQINYVVPASIAAGYVTTTRAYLGTLLVGHGTVVVNRLASALFSADSTGQGLASGQLLRVNKADPTQQTYDNLTTAGNTWDPNIEDAYLILYGTGFRRRSSLSLVTCTVDNISVPVTYAGAQGSYAGLDQTNIGPLPQNLKGHLGANVRLSVEGQIANIVKVYLR